MKLESYLHNELKPVDHHLWGDLKVTIRQSKNSSDAVHTTEEILARNNAFEPGGAVDQLIDVLPYMICRLEEYSATIAIKEIIGDLERTLDRLNAVKNGTKPEI